MTITDGVITPETADEIVARGWETYRRAMESEWPGGDGSAVGVLVWDLHDALDTYSALLNDLIHPAAEWPDLADHPEPKHEALRRAAQDAADWEAELIRVFPAAAVVATRTEEAA
jgi:hypothetical protein